MAEVTLLIACGLNLGLLLYNIEQILDDGACWRIPLIILNAVAAIVPLVYFIKIKRREKMVKKIRENFERLFDPADCTEIQKLHEMLTSEGVPHDFIEEEHLGGFHVYYPPLKQGDGVLSAVTNFGSYGHEKGLIEIMGLLTEAELEHDTVAGWLTAEDVFARIKQHWKSNGKTEEQVCKTLE